VGFFPTEKKVKKIKIKFRVGNLLTKVLTENFSVRNSPRINKTRPHIKIIKKAGSNSGV